VTVKRFEWGTFLDTYTTGKEEDYNMYTLGWVDEFDPHQYLYFLFHPSQTSTNGTYYKNQEVAKQIKKAGRMTDRSQRKKLYIDAVTTLLKDRVHLPAYNLNNTFGVRDNVKDFKVHTLAQLNPRMVSNYNNVYIQQ
ncbi:MAG: ABC transporter substrate-binding protein, partial [Halobacteriaceae archaeon]